MKPVGYLWLKKQYSIETLDYWVTSFVQEKGTAVTEITNGRVRALHRAGTWPGDHWTNHLEFALKREGIHLELLRKLCLLLPQEEVLNYVKATPTGRYARITWYLYEGLTGDRLPIENLRTGQLRPTTRLESLSDRQPA